MSLPNLYIEVFITSVNECDCVWRKLLYKNNWVKILSLGASPVAQCKESICNAWDSGDVGLILGRSPGGGHGDPFQYSFLENPIDRGVWQTPRFIESQRVGHNCSSLAGMRAHTQSLGWPDLIWLLSWSKGKFGHRHARRENDKKTQRRWPSRRELRKSQPCPNLGLRLWPPKLGQKTILLSQPLTL